MVPFHLAFPVKDLESVKAFYTDILNCEIGRESEQWIDINFFGHQITAHLDTGNKNSIAFNSVDEKSIPARHFGVILSWQGWDDLIERIKSFDITFYIKPYTRFAGQIGEQRTFFIQDTSENYLEFKCFKDETYIFKHK